MPRTPSDLSLADVKAAVNRLKHQLDVDLQNVTTVGSPSLATITNQHDKLKSALDSALASASMSSNPGADWVLWLNNGIGDSLQTYAASINAVLGNSTAELGECTYLDGGPVCITQAQCSMLPDFVWNAGCP